MTGKHVFITFLLIFTISFAHAQNKVFGVLEISGNDTIAGWNLIGNDSIFYGKEAKEIFTSRGDTQNYTRISNYSQRQFTPNNLIVFTKKNAPNYLLEETKYGQSIIKISWYEDGIWLRYRLNAISLDTIERSKSIYKFESQNESATADYVGSFSQVKWDEDSTEINFKVFNGDSVYVKTIRKSGKTVWRKSFTQDRNNWRFECLNCVLGIEFTTFGSDQPEDVSALIPRYFEERKGPSYSRELYTKKSKVFLAVNGEKIKKVKNDSIVKAVEHFYTRKETGNPRGAYCGSEAYYLPDSFLVSGNFVVNDTLDFNRYLENQSLNITTDGQMFYPSPDYLKAYVLTFDKGKLIKLKMVFSDTSRTFSTEYLQQREHPFSWLMDKTVSENYKKLEKNSDGNWVPISTTEKPFLTGELQVDCKLFHFW